MNFNYPFKIDDNGRTEPVKGEEKYIRDLVEQVLFTSPGERVNRPDFGTGIIQLIFNPNSNELATATQFLVQGALERWLGNLIQVESVETNSSDSTLHVSVQYSIRRTQQRQIAKFSRET